MSLLLDDVSIVVTPNGYKAGTLYGVLPTYAEGSELITNGDGSSTSGWDLAYPNTTLSIDDDNLRATANSSGAYGLSQSLSLDTSKRYIIRATIDVDNASGGTANLRFSTSSNLSSGITTLSTETGASTTILNPSASTMYIGIVDTADDDSDYVEIDNISVKELISSDMDVTRATAATRVDEDGLINYAEILGDEDVTCGDFSCAEPNAVWTKNANWTIANNLATSDGSQTGNVSLKQSNTLNNLTTGTTYKVQFTISGYIAGVINPHIRGAQSGNVTGDGIKTSYITAGSGSDGINLYAGSTFEGSVSNISVKEVTRDNVPRIDYTGGGCPHILSEPARTNLITYSENFSDSFWNQVTADVTVTTNTNPSGESGTYSVERVTGSQLGASFSITSGNDYTASWYVRNISGTGAIIIKDTNNSTNNFTATSEWQRFSVTATASSTTGRCYLQVPTVNDEVEVWGAQFEEGSYATSYIPTSGSTVTRNQDIFTRDGISSLINSEEGSFFLDIAAISATPGAQLSISLSGNGSTDRILIFTGSGGGQWNVQFKKDGGTFLNVKKNITISNQSKLAVSWKSGKYLVYIDGDKATNYTVGSETESTTFDVGDLKNLQFNPNYGTTSNPFLGKVRQLQVYDTALDDTQLDALTS